MAKQHDKHFKLDAVQYYKEHIDISKLPTEKFDYRVMVYDLDNNQKIY